MPSSHASTPSSVSRFDQPYLSRILLPQHQNSLNINSPQRNRTSSVVPLDQLFYVSPSSTAQRGSSSSTRSSKHFYVESTSPSLSLLNFQSPHRIQPQRLRQARQMRLMNRPRISDLTTRRPSNIMERAVRILESKKKRSTPLHRTPSPSGSNDDKRSCRSNNQENNSHPSTPVLSLPTVQLAAGEPIFACTSLYDFSTPQHRTTAANSPHLVKTEQAVTLRPKLKPSLPPNSLAPSCRPSSAMLPERVSCLSSATLEALAFGSQGARQSKKRKAKPNDNSFESKRFVASTISQALDDALLDDLDNSIISSPVSKRAALRDIQTQTTSTIFSEHQFVKPSEVQQRPVLKHTSSVSQFITGLEARARANALMRSKNRRSKSVLDFNKNGGDTSLQARHANIRHLFANLANSISEEATSSSNAIVPTLTCSVSTSSAFCMPPTTTTSAPIGQDSIIPSTSSSNLSSVDNITSVTGEAPSTTGSSMPIFTFSASSSKEAISKPLTPPVNSVAEPRSTTNSTTSTAANPTFCFPKSTTMSLSTSSPVIPAFSFPTSTQKSDLAKTIPAFTIPKVDAPPKPYVNPIVSATTATSTAESSFKLPTTTAGVTGAPVSNFPASNGMTQSNTIMTTTSLNFPSNFTSSNNNAPSFNFSYLPSSAKTTSISSSGLATAAPTFQLPSTSTATPPAFNFSVNPTVASSAAAAPAFNLSSSTSTPTFNFNMKSGLPSLPAFNFRVTSTGSNETAPKPLFATASSPETKTTPVADTKPSFSFGEKTDSTIPVFNFSVSQSPAKLTPAFSFSVPKSDQVPFVLKPSISATSIFTPPTATMTTDAGLLNGAKAATTAPSLFSSKTVASSMFVFDGTSTTVAPSSITKPSMFSFGTNKQDQTQTTNTSSGTNIFTATPSTSGGSSGFNFDFKNTLTSVKSSPSGLNLTPINSTIPKSSENSLFSFGTPSIAVSGRTSTTVGDMLTDKLKRTSSLAFGSAPNMAITAFGKSVSHSPFNVETTNSTASPFDQAAKTLTFGITPTLTVSNSASPIFGQTMPAFSSGVSATTSTPFGQTTSAFASPFSQASKIPAFGQTTPTVVSPFGQSFAFGGGNSASLVPSTAATTTGVGFNFSANAVNPDSGAFVFGGPPSSFGGQQVATNPFSVPMAPNAAASLQRRRNARLKNRR